MANPVLKLQKVTQRRTSGSWGQSTVQRVWNRSAIFIVPLHSHNTAISLFLQTFVKKKRGNNSRGTAKQIDTEEIGGHGRHCILNLFQSVPLASSILQLMPTDRKNMPRTHPAAMLCYWRYLYDSRRSRFVSISADTHKPFTANQANFRSFSLPPPPPAHSIGNAARKSLGFRSARVRVFA